MVFTPSCQAGNKNHPKMGRPDTRTREIFPSTNHIDLAILFILAETGGGLVVSNGFSTFLVGHLISPLMTTWM